MNKHLARFLLIVLAALLTVCIVCYFSSKGPWPLMAVGAIVVIVGAAYLILLAISGLFVLVEWLYKHATKDDH